MRIGKFFPAACAAVFCLVQLALAQGEQQQVKVLAIGNSFTAPTVVRFAALANAAGIKLILGKAIKDGSSLEFHAKAVEAYEKDPNDPAGRPYPNNASLAELLKQEKWDYVTIQQVSQQSYDVQRYRPWAQQLYDYIKARAPQAEILMFQTWAWRDDDLSFKQGKLTPEQMYRGLRESYDTIAKELGIRLIPVGDAFWMVRMSPGWEYNPAWTNIDKDAYKEPAVPDQRRSLHRGWRWTTRGNPPQRTMINDTHHPSVAGAYLAACCWFEAIFRRSVVGNTYVPEELSKEDAAFLQDIAHKVVAEGVRPPLPEVPMPAVETRKADPKGGAK